MGPEELGRLASQPALDERTVIEILRNPYCSSEVAMRLAARAELMSSTRVRRLVCEIDGLPTPKVSDLLGTLPWVPLLELAQEPRTPPMVRKMAERKLLLKLEKMTSGERTALARRAHRAIFHAVARIGDERTFAALLENPKLTERDLVSILNSGAHPPTAPVWVNRNSRWATRRTVRLAVARSPATPVPVALSAIAELGTNELTQLARDPKISAPVREAVRGLLRRRGNTLGETVL